MGGEETSVLILELSCHAVYIPRCDDSYCRQLSLSLFGNESKVISLLSFSVNDLTGKVDITFWGRTRKDARLVFLSQVSATSPGNLESANLECKNLLKAVKVV